ncbi:GFA family protein [Hydrocarboniclastica marina]|uniref:GFA family protein n=1 Tax=Hydrocarboniclastica marina TaxID=2259620 RepID=A0A4P7XJA6_9ALTE|nr:GFA family protein [Hydrocarboniclastica marina]QCF27201.1 GFA family protein [Hydrocarboniclastica marina]
MLQGCCLCERIQYEYSGELGPIAMCHCSQCRRAQGSAFATNSPILASQFRFTAGQESVKEYESRPGKKRAFCRECGSPLYSRLDSKPDVLRLRIGTLTTPIDARPSHHIYANSAAEWFEFTDGLPRFAELEDGPLV